MLYQFLQTFRIFPYSLLWFMFQVEPNVHVKRGMILFIMGAVMVFHSLGCSLITSLTAVGVLLEIAIRTFIILP